MIVSEWNEPTLVAGARVIAKVRLRVVNCVVLAFAPLALLCFRLSAHRDHLRYTFSCAFLLWFVANLQVQESRDRNLGPVVEMQTPTMRSSTRKNAT